MAQMHFTPCVCQYKIILYLQNVSFITWLSEIHFKVLFLDHNKTISAQIDILCIYYFHNTVTHLEF